MAATRARVGVLAVGDELVAGAHPDLNSPAIAASLAELGRSVARVIVVGDDETAIAASIAELSREHDVVIVTGGLGPTLDDVTRHAAARAAGVPLVTSQPALRELQDWYARAGREMPRSNERQALLPEGAEILPNSRGTAPGFRLRVGASELFVLPGPPHEMQAMLAACVTPWLAAHPVDDGELRVRRFHLVGLSESVFADQAGDWMVRGANPLIGVTVKGGVMSVRLIAHGASVQDADGTLARRAAEFEERFGQYVFSREDARIAFVLGQELIERGVTVAVAESCTGGLVTAALTDVPGISAVFREGFVTYSNEAKIERLGVPGETIERHGAVSAEVAEAMARGAAERSRARLAVATTGIAGPGGGTPAKPVGLVWFAVAFEGTVRSVEVRFPDAGRDRIREWAATKALVLLLRALRGESL